MFQKFTKISLALAMLLSLVIDTSVSAVSRLHQLADITAEAELQEYLRKQCCCTNAICVGSTDNPVGPQGSVFFDPIAQAIFLSTGTGIIEIADTEPAPAVITVDPSFTNPNNVTQFTTIQGAINSLGNKKIVDTQINIAPGTYPENVVLQSILNSDADHLRIVGDARPMVGVGIVNNSFWNVTATPTVPVGGGVNSVAVITGTAGTNTLTLTNSGGGIQPNFTAAGGVIVGDRVLIRDDAGGYNTYTVSAVAPTVLTFTTNILATVGASTSAGGFMIVLPRVIIAPSTGVAIKIAAFVTLQGLYFIGLPAQATMNLLPNSVTYATNNVTFGGQLGVLASRESFPGFVASSPLLFSTTTTYGNSFVGATQNGVTNRGGHMDIGHSLIAGAQPAGGSLVQPSPGSVGKVAHSKFIAPFLIELSLLLSVGNIDVFSGGNAVTVRYGSLFALAGRLRVFGATTRAVDTQLDSGFFIPSILGSSLQVFSTAANCTVLDIRQESRAEVSLSSITLPGTAASFIGRVREMSDLKINNATGTQIIGADSNGFLVENESHLLWDTGSIAGNAASTAGTLFDIRRNSSLTFGPIASSTFTNYFTTFRFDDSSEGIISGTTSTTLPGGTNLSVINMSTVEIAAVTLFNLSGANIGIQTASGGYVGQKGLGTPVINLASIPYSPVIAHRTTAAALTTYAQSYDDGTIVVNP